MNLIIFRTIQSNCKIRTPGKVNVISRSFRVMRRAEGGLVWEGESLNIMYIRSITDMSGNVIDIDTSVFHHFDRSLSQSVTYKFDETYLVTESGTENIRMDIDSVNPTPNYHTKSGNCFLVQPISGLIM
jgi:hypothetical protein